MNNPIGYGVFGTFGDPYGYQQVFYYGVDFKESLDLDDDAIVFYPGSDLYAIKRVLVDEVYTVCLCKYSFAVEKNTERQNTFIGSCIVLQNSYADADDIYRVLCEMHENLTSNDSNFDGNTLKVAQVDDVYIREPADFVALRANVIPISKTPFASKEVAVNRQYLVSPGTNSQSSKDAQIITFFDEGLKYYGETGTLYFSFDVDVNEYVGSKGHIETIPWETFLEQKYSKQSTIVVRTKKGIQKISGGDTPVEIQKNGIPSFVSEENEPVIIGSGSYIPPRTQYVPYPSSLVDDENDEHSYDDDNKKPFDLWEDPIPVNGWPADKVRAKVNEYNRLFRYTNTLLDYINEPSNKKRNRNRITERKNTERTYAKETAAPPKKGSKRGLVLVLLFILILGSITVYYMAEENYETPPILPAPATTSPVSMDNPILEDNDTVPIAITENSTADKPEAQQQKATDQANKITTQESQETTKAPIGPQPYTQEKQAETVQHISEPANVPVADINNKEKEATPKNRSVKSAVPYVRANELHPKPNMELPSNDITAFNQTDVKNKTLAELVKLLYDNVPSNIGNVYKGQENEYAAALLNGNRQVFQKAGSDYVCTADNATTLRIPAYKSPRLPVVYPK